MTFNPIVHTSVLLEEAVQALNPGPNKTYVDGTLGGGGHARYLCEQLDASNDFIGIDQDPVALAEAASRLEGLAPKINLVRGNFGDLHSLVIAQGYPKIDGGVLVDLGVSDFQIKNPERGFSFQHDAPLDMRMNPELTQTAETLVNTLSEKALADIFYQYADERLSRHIAALITQKRPLQTTKQLAEIAETVYRFKGVKAKNIHPATRIFQALRIAVNQEVKMLEAFLQQLPQVLLPGARVAIITFHSIEDRLVKQYFRENTAECLCPPRQPVCTCNHKPPFKLIGKPITPSDTEVKRNPQSRSAKLRVAERK